MSFLFYCADCPISMEIIVPYVFQGVVVCFDLFIVRQFHINIDRVTIAARHDHLSDITRDVYDVHENVIHLD